MILTQRINSFSQYFYQIYEMAQTLTYIPTLIRVTIIVTIVNSNFGIMESMCDKAFSQAH